MKCLKLISKEEVEKLIEKDYLRNTPRGYVDRKGYTVGFYKTRNKRYIEDKYADIARKIS